MTRRLEVLPGLPAAELSVRLRIALANDGPALLPREAGAPPGGDGSAGGDGHHGAGADEAAAATPLPEEVPKAVALVIETSGSTGVPKRVALSADALLASAAASEQALGGPGQWLLALPTHYVAGVQVLVRSITAGTDVVVHPPGHFSPETFAELAGRLEHPQRYTSLVPAQLARLVDAAGGDRAIRRAVARFDAILVGGQSLPEPLRERALDVGFSIVRTYGASETAGGCVYEGRPIGRTVVRVVDGELEIAGPTLAEGYLGDDALTASRFHVDERMRWYRTTDSGTVVDGVVTVTGRLDDLIISGGIKVSLGRVERIVQSQPGCEQAVVVPQHSDRWGQVGVVVTESPSSPAGEVGPDPSPDPAPDSALEVDGEHLEQLRRAVVALAGRAAAPAALVRVESLPRLSSGKPDRRLIEQVVARLLAQRHAEATPQPSPHQLPGHRRREE